MTAILEGDGDKAAELLREHVLVGAEKFTDLMASLGRLSSAPPLKPLPRTRRKAEALSQSARYRLNTAPIVPGVRSFLNTSPPFITNFTRCVSLMSLIGSPDTATMSANFPFVIEPT